jgi:hypothetical protein
MKDWSNDHLAGSRRLETDKGDFFLFPSGPGQHCLSKSCDSSDSSFPRASLTCLPAESSPYRSKTWLMNSSSNHLDSENNTEAVVASYTLCIPYSRCLVSEVLQISDFLHFGIFTYTSWALLGRWPKSKHDIYLCFIYTLHFNLKVILYDISMHPCFYCHPPQWSGIETFICGLMLILRKFQIF